MSHSRCFPLSADERAALSAFAHEVGDYAAANRLEVSIGTLARAVAGWPVQRATRTHLRVRLDLARSSRPSLGVTGS